MGSNMAKNIAYNTYSTTRRWLFSCLLFLPAVACTTRPGNDAALKLQLQQITDARVSHAAAAVSQAKQLLQQGDIITRTGTDFTSESLRHLCRRDHTYSHCGIVSIEHDSFFVYHALGGETNPDQHLKKDALEQFCDGRSNRGFGIFRMPLTPGIAHSIDSLLKAYYAQQLPFDMDFNLQTDDKMYCSELVYKVFSRAFHSPHLFSITHTPQLDYVGIDDIFLQPLCREIRRFGY